MIIAPTFISFRSRRSLALEKRQEEYQVTVESDGFNTKKITSRVAIDTDFDNVWRFLTDYTHHKYVFPNTKKSYIIPYSPPNVKRVFTESTKKIIGFNSTMDFVIDYTEEALGAHRPDERRLLFKIEDSSAFDKYEGSFVLKNTLSSNTFNPCVTLLEYTVLFRPKNLVPVIIFEWALKEDISALLYVIKRLSEDRAKLQYEMISNVENSGDTTDNVIHRISDAENGKNIDAHCDKSSQSQIATEGEETVFEVIKTKPKKRASIA